MTLDQLITFSRLEQVRDEFGTLVTEKVKIGDALANVRPMSGMERNQSQQTEASADYVFTVLYRRDIDEKTVIDWAGDVFNVRFPRFTGSGDVYLKIEAQKGVAV